MRLGSAALLILVLVMALNACREKPQSQQTAGNARSAVPESEKLADFTLPTLTGESVNLRSFEGEKVVVVNFWATWCGPCRREIPDFNEVYASYRDRGVEFLGISLDDDPRAAVPAFMARIPIAYPVLVGSPEIAMRYNVNGIPHTIIIDRAGRVVNNFVGMLSAGQLREVLEQALRNSPQS
ncbi:MAG: TlpA family protein disulfide reductase [candidate division KSB1 bacterium]|nr:TlpA family protein disulfide reductase [candidate division KSB1 bacterium]MDZ7276517.1 TlpA family protein disulfide reductase [candidate division KSB1 bacterium]MDZ7286702.1 TlpA family protein disulfide reductase [candidate division KSB1 bacterium]MDZ7300287.1 TlpA family protein disulfide reductase [candidate division KSB1 bacterium]MDZ7307888.1 TlpA family protein disulfide reductase [candidate division KSB1 bacterium]